MKKSGLGVVPTTSRRRDGVTVEKMPIMAFSERQTPINRGMEVTTEGS